jgi:hypothetical protein
VAEWNGELKAALNQYDFGEAEEILFRNGYRSDSTERQVCIVGMDVMQLDAEEFGRHATTCSALPHGLANDLNKCSWPNRMQERDSNALDDLAPTYCLLLELVDIKLRRRDWNDVLALIHLMSEYLGLLVWQSTLSHGGRPNLLASRFSLQVSRPRTREQCALDDNEYRLMETLQSPLITDNDLRKYLHGQHSRVSEMLVTCGGAPGGVNAGTKGACRRPCSVVTGPADDLAESDRRSLALRSTLARIFAQSDLVTMRHTSPVGHFFAVPGANDISSAWRTTRMKLNRALDEAGANQVARIQSDFPAGLTDLLQLCAGEGITIAKSQIVRRLRAEVGRPFGFACTDHHSESTHGSYYGGSHGGATVI